VRTKKSGPRVTGWSKIFLDYIDAHGGERLHVLTEAELLEAVLLAGRRINDDYRTVIAHAMRAIGWKIREVSRTYIRRAPKAANVAAPVVATPAPEVLRARPRVAATEGGAS